MNIQRHIDFLSKEKISAGQIAGVVYSLYHTGLNSDKNNEKIEQVMTIVKERLTEMHIDLASSQMRYAIKLATANGDLLYEEMHKLFSLRDDIHAIEKMGFICDENLKNEVDEALLYRFKKEPGSATMVAEDKLEDWNRDLWWYKYNLGGRKAKK